LKRFETLQNNIGEQHGCLLNKTKEKT